jgi:NADPH2:quinone reductase
MAPALMKAAFINKTGTPDVIEYGELPTPKVSRKQCLIKVAAVDVNPIDLYVRSGAIPGAQPFPWILGRDLAGTVLECGAGVSSYKPERSRLGLEPRSGWKAWYVFRAGGGGRAMVVPCARGRFG